jgi:uncharacterized protein
MDKILVVILTLAFWGLLDLYVYQLVKVLIKGFSSKLKKSIIFLYWGFTLFMLTMLTGSMFYHSKFSFRYGPFLNTFLIIYAPKFVAAGFLLFDDLIRFFKMVKHKAIPKKDTKSEERSNKISRSEFLMKSAALVAALPFVGAAYGTIYGAYDFTVRRQKIFLPNLPAAFDGLRIAQISDIHSGSFYNKVAVKGGIDMLLNEKPDLVFFTGDLVNHKAIEMYHYQNILDKIKAPLGVYAVLGNHDYGDYVNWPTREAKEKNFLDLIEIQKQMGWKLLRNEHTYLEQSSEKIALLGVENWGVRGFSQYGDIHKAYQGSEADVKILLSHDPSHWDQQVRPFYQDIDLTLSGHTHGSQVGIEIGDLQWGVMQYRYKQWAGLYKEGSQYIYVNRGFGFVGIPTRIGIPPEITIIELKKGIG